MQFENSAQIGDAIQVMGAAALRRSKNHFDWHVKIILVSTSTTNAHFSSENYRKQLFADFS